MQYTELISSQFVKTDDFNSSESRAIHIPERGMQIFLVESEGAANCRTGSTQIKRIVWYRVDPSYFEIQYIDSNRKNTVHAINDDLTIDVYQIKRTHLGVF